MNVSVGDPTLDDFQAALDALLKQAGLKSGKQARAAMAAWNAAVDAELRAHTRVVNLTQGTLVVEVDSYALLQELQTFRAADILQRVRGAAALEIHGIRYAMYRGV